MKQYPLEEFNGALESAASVDIYLPSNPNFDQVASALALRLALSKKGKSVSVFSPSEMTVEFNRLVGVEKIGEKVSGGRDLVVTIEYPLDQVEKVTSNDDGGKLNLVIQPKEGSPRIETSDLSFNYVGGGQGMAVLVGVEEIGQLGSLAEEVNLAEAVNIDNSIANLRYGKVNLVDPLASSLAEMMVNILSGLNVAPDEDLANNLLLGLNQATNAFKSEKTGPDTFEAVAACLRWGASRNILQEKNNQNSQNNQTEGNSEKKPIFSQRQEVKTPVQKEEKKDQKQSDAPAPDWLEPKIFKSSDLS